jgi:ATP-dependent Lon protease
VIIPHANARELEELPIEVREAVEFHPVRTMDEVMAIVLRGVAAALPELPDAPAGAPNVGRAATVAH